METKFDIGKVQRINAVAPIRICDVGGWTDTWFSGFGNIFNIAVYPYVEVQLTVSRGSEGKAIIINLENFNDSYTLNPEHIEYDKHPLIEAAIDIMSIPKDLTFEVNIYSQAPPGASTGTSAAVSVALIGALDRLTEGRLTPHEAAALAHSVETEKLHLQCGIQDQLCSAYGGINYIQMYQFPHASVSSIMIPNSTWWELENRLTLVYIGSPHASSEIHKKVIADLGDHAEQDPRLCEMRKLAEQAKNALYEGDFKALGTAMDRNTDVQRYLHKELVCPKFEEMIDIAKHFEALGCKVNGAGGDGGSMTILTNGDNRIKRDMINTLQEKGFRHIPIYLSRFGLRVW